MPRTRSWRSLLPGLAALAATVGAAAAVLMFARVGALHGSTVRIYTKTLEARGVMKGTAVWLSGQKIGQVVSIDFLPPSTDTTAHVVLEMDVLEKYLKFVRRDAQAQIRAGGTLIGAPVVYLSGVTSNAPPAREGDTLFALPQGDPESIASRIAVASRDFPQILTNVKELRTQLGSVRGTTGAFLNEGGLELDVVAARGKGLASRALSGDGTVGRALKGGDMMSRAKSALARADSIRALVASKETSLGRFRRDSSLMRTVASVRAEVSVARALLDEPRGTAGRVLHDEAITSELAGALRALDALMADLRAHPMRYVRF